MIVDPKYRPGEDVIARLNRAVAEEILNREKTEFSRGERARLSDWLAIDAAKSMLRPLNASIRVEDANERRRNNPGFDLILDGRIRIQVKGGTYVDSIGTTHTFGVPNAADLDYDLLFLIDIGVVLNPRPAGPRGDGRDHVSTKPHVDFYIVPNAVVRQQVALGTLVNKRGAHLYYYKRKINPSTQDWRGQWFDLPKWHSRFDLVDSSLDAI